jgi:hypothetical protein
LNDCGSLFAWEIEGARNEEKGENVKIEWTCGGDGKLCAKVLERSRY